MTNTEIRDRTRNIRRHVDLAEIVIKYFGDIPCRDSVLEQLLGMIQEDSTAINDSVGAER